MADERGDERGQRDNTGTSMKRRGILRAAGTALGVIVAGLAAKQSSQPVAADISSSFNANDSSISSIAFLTQTGTAYDTAVSVAGVSYGVYGSSGGGIGVYGSTSSGTGVKGASDTHGGVVGTSNSGEGVSGTSGVTGVHGASTGGGYGVIGTSNGSLPAVYGDNTSGNNAIGVQGYTKTAGIGVLGGTKGDLNPANGIGVQGRIDGGYAVQGLAAGGFGVRGESDSGTGVYGQIGSGAFTKAVWGKHLVNGYGVYGEATGNGAIGVQGVITSSPNGRGVSGDGGTQGYGVYGSGQYGVYGTSATLHGVVGVSGTSAGASGVVAVGQHPGAIGFQGVAQGGAIYAGYFYGSVSIQKRASDGGGGDLGVAGAKFAVVKGKDGKHRGMYAMESPECWFEDFGTGKLVNGAAAVTFDPLFAQHVHTDAYHVFLTPYDAACKGLAVTQRRADGFAVQELYGGSTSGVFSWRVAGRRNDIANERLPIWEMPSAVIASPPPPEPKTQPDTRTPPPNAPAPGGAGSAPVQPIPPSR